MLNISNALCQIWRTSDNNLGSTSLQSNEPKYITWGVCVSIQYIFKIMLLPSSPLAIEEVSKR